MALPFKIFTLTLKTISKPLAARFTAFALNHPVARGHIINTAQRLHRLEVAIARGAEGKTGPAFVGDLTEEKAVELAGKVASEGFVWGVATVVLGLEVSRQARKDAAKKEAEASYRAAAEARTADVAATAAAAAAAAARAADAAAEMGGRLDAIERRLAASGRAGVAVTPLDNRSWLSAWQTSVAGTVREWQGSVAGP